MLDGAGGVRGKVLHSLINMAEVSALSFASGVPSVSAFVLSVFDSTRCEALSRGGRDAGLP
jgi:hypothetical protein